ncbi:SDR family NAD(P)-dependent oxidoreductase [Candidatus Amarobacter glycogenicus]|uniref:SDR family NAD(P)-dependent oxidoreductase n=1 Tax=Candidatus Amarobacter glycogenicus TaxID=3140699 RepID=UPI002A0D58E2|nr:SDR family oxidoreductase [Dehalococcoidia bacterium]MBK9613015.1 SDR family oxidoreductase [Dehalococcoidia bacterium]
MVLERLRLDGPPRKVVIVTGGGRGLGKAMAISLAEAGADVCIASRTVSQLESAAAEIAAAGGRRPLIVPTNVQKREECDALIEKTVAHFGRLDVMLNNAGIGDRRGAGDRIQDLEDADWHDTIEVNLHSAFYCSRAATRQFLKQGGGGVIVNVASGTALRSSPQSLGYAAAKAGVISITKSLAAQLVGEDIRVNCIIPGYVAQSPAQTDDEVSMRKQRGRFITVRRLGEAWELGALAVFLCSDASSYITGESFPIDGGGLAGGIAPTGFAMAETVEASRA